VSPSPLGSPVSVTRIKKDFPSHSGTLVCSTGPAIRVKGGQRQVTGPLKERKVEPLPEK
jgi:hypothetical protein